MKRIVIKVGSAVLTQDGLLAKTRLDNLMNFISLLRKKSYEVILVSSGAVAAGHTSLKLDISDVAQRQALAALGQPLLMKYYYEGFEKLAIKCAQVLLIADDFRAKNRIAHSKNAIEMLLAKNIIPIINENDVIAVKELLFGDNDQLAANVAYHFNAKYLMILTDVDGFYDKNPKVSADAKLQKYIYKIEPKYSQSSNQASSSFAQGGIATKLKAAKFLIEKNIPTFLSSGFDLKYAKEYFLENKHNGGTIFKIKD